jgi:phosphoribosylpyrophosphate synthetase
LIRHVFRRNKTGDKDRDGNPLIYALKGLHGYNITPAVKHQFLERATEIVRSFSHELDAEMMVPLPSGNAFCSEFAELLCQATGLKLRHADFIRKRTIKEMLALHGDALPTDLSENTRNAVKSQLAAWRRMNPGQLVSMKHISPKIRHCFEPVTLSGDISGFAGHSVVLVDDLMATGASMTSASNLFRSFGCAVTSGICFLSDL